MFYKKYKKYALRLDNQTRLSKRMNCWPQIEIKISYFGYNYCLFFLWNIHMLKQALKTKKKIEIYQTKEKISYIYT